MKFNALDTTKIVHVAPDGTSATTYALSAGTTDVNSSAVDALGYENISFVCVFGDNVDTGTFTGGIEGSADGSNNWTDITGATSSFTAGATDTDNEMLGIGCQVDPAYRYYRFTSDRGTANTVIAALICLLTSPDRAPVTQATTAGQFIQAPVVV